MRRGSSLTIRDSFGAQLNSPAWVPPLLLLVAPVLTTAASSTLTQPTRSHIVVHVLFVATVDDVPHTRSTHAHSEALSMLMWMFDVPACTSHVQQNKKDRQSSLPTFCGRVLPW